MKVIVGLGNPGLKYKNTFHNVGFMVVDYIAKKLDLKFVTKACDSKIAKGKYKGEDFILAKPETFMNLSGTAVKQLIKKFDINEKFDLIVVYDDVDIKLGALRLREEGSAGTHNGMRNIIQEINTQEFKRVRVGTKTQALENKEIALIDFVLSKMEYEDKKLLDVSVEKAALSILELISGEDIQRVQEKLNRA